MFFKRLQMALAGVLLAALAGAQSDGTGYIVQAGAVVDNFESGGWLKWDLGYIENSSLKRKSGLTSLKMMASPGAEVLARKSMVVDMRTSATIGLWVYVEQPAQWDMSTLVGLSLSSDNFASEMHASTRNLRQGWNKVVFSAADFQSRNGATWGRFTHVQIRLFDMGYSSTIYVDDLMVGQYSRPKVVISFDDTYDDHYTEAYAYMRTLGLKGTCYINSSFVGRVGRLTEAQMQELYDAGWDLSNHTDTHTDLTQLSLAGQEAEIARCRNYLINKGWTRRNAHLHFAYPFGFYNQDSLTALENTGMLTARTTWESRQSNALDEKFLLYAQLPDTNRPSPAGLMRLLDLVVQSGGLYEVSYHMIVTTPPQVSTQIPQAEFREVVDYIARLQQQGVLDVVTKSEWYEGLSGAQLTGVVLDQATIMGGQSGSGRVNLNQTAGPTGKAIALSSSSSTLTVPTNVTVAPGSTFASFTFSTTTVTADKTVTITATDGTATFTANILVRPTVTLSAVSLSPSTVMAGQATILTVRSNRRADSLFTVTLSSSSTAATAPATVTIPATVDQGSVLVTTNPAITQDTTVTLTARANGVTKSAQLSIRRLPILNSVSLSDSDVRGGSTITGTVRLDRNAPSGGLVVTIPGRDYVTMPGSVTVPSGASRANFTIMTSTVSSTRTVSIAATFNGITKTKTLTLRR